jgi:chemotaxis protein methyltransferase CheR
MDRVERLSRERMQRFFLKGTGSQAGFVRVRPELQRLIEFSGSICSIATGRCRGL